MSIRKGLDIDWESLLKRPRKILGEMDVNKTAGHSLEEKVLNFIKSHSSSLRLGLKWGDFKHISTQTTLNGKIIRYQQLFGAYNVQDAFLVIKLDHKNRIKSIQISPKVISAYIFNILGRVSPPVLIKFLSLLTGLPISHINPPTMTSDDALNVTLKVCGLTYQNIRDEDIKSNRIKFKPSIDRIEGRWRWDLVYYVDVPTNRVGEHWQVVIDAYSSKSRPRILQKNNLIMPFQIIGMTTGPALCSIPSPIVEFFQDLSSSRDPQTGWIINPRGRADQLIRNKNDIKKLKDLTIIDDGGQQYVILTGPFVDIKDIVSPPDGPYIKPVKISVNKLNQTLLSTSIGQPYYQDILVYYTIDSFQRYLQDIGLIGICDKPIAVDVHSNNYDRENAWFDPCPTFSKIGEIYLGFGISPGFDPSEDAEVVIHEYGHAIFHNQAKLSYDNERKEEVKAINEGFAIFLPCAYFGTCFPDYADVFCDWSDYNPDSYSQKDNAPFFYVHWRNPTSGAFPRYPDDLSMAKGFLWSTLLWNIFSSAGGVDPSKLLPEREEISQDFFQALITSLSSIYPHSTMIDAAENLMEEDANLEDYRGRLLPKMLDAFLQGGIFSTCPEPNVTIRNRNTRDGSAFPLKRDSNPRRCSIWTEKWIDDGKTHINICAKIRNLGDRIRAYVITFSVSPTLTNQRTQQTTSIKNLVRQVGFRLNRYQSIRTELPDSMKPNDPASKYIINIELYFGNNLSPVRFSSIELPLSAFQ
jgi:hypothetical protein